MLVGMSISRHRNSNTKQGKANGNKFAVILGIYASGEKKHAELLELKMN